jgi:hypothetical protein
VRIARILYVIKKVFAIMIPTSKDDAASVAGAADDAAGEAASGPDGSLGRLAGRADDGQGLRLAGSKAGRV